MKECFVFSLESPHWGGSNEYTQHAIIKIKKRITLNYSKYNKDFFLRDSKTSRGKRAIGDQAIEVLLYYFSHKPV